MAGTIQNDILKEYIARGTYIYPPRAAMRIVTDFSPGAARSFPHWNTISLAVITSAKPDPPPAQEVAFTLRTASHHRGRPQAGLESTPSRRAFLSSSTRTGIASGNRQVPRRPPALGGKLSHSRSGARIPAPSLRFQRNRRLFVSPRNNPKTTSSAQPSRHSPRFSRQAVTAHQLHATKRSALPTEESARIALAYAAVIAVRERDDTDLSLSAAPMPSNRLTNKSKPKPNDYSPTMNDIGGTLRPSNPASATRDPKRRLRFPARRRTKRTDRRRR